MAGIAPSTKMFKIGDKVRFTSSLFGSTLYGREGTVIEPINPYQYKVNFEGLGAVYYLEAKYLMLVNPRTFRIGERVRTRNGRIGRVICSGTVSTQLEFAGACPRTLGFTTESLEPVDPATALDLEGTRIKRDSAYAAFEKEASVCHAVPATETTSKETTTMQIGSHAVTDVTRDSVKVGCQTVTREQAKAVLDAMDAVPKSAFTVRKSTIAPDIVRVAGNKERYGNSPYGFWASENGKWTNTEILINATKDELRDLIAELQKFV